MQLSVLVAFLSVALASVCWACGGSSSETPPPVEPIEQRLRVDDVDGDGDRTQPKTPSDADAEAPASWLDTEPSPPGEGIAPVAPL